jgi:hypothetical protein
MKGVQPFMKENSCTYRVRFNAVGFKTAEVPAVAVNVTETPVLDEAAARNRYGCLLYEELSQTERATAQFQGALLAKREHLPCMHKLATVYLDLAEIHTADRRRYRLPLRYLPVPGSFQPVQPVPVLLAHCNSFHPSALRLSIGTFYFAQSGTSHLAATPLNSWSRTISEF